MKRDFDLIRSIMTDIENIPAGEYRQEFEYTDYDDATVYCHIELLSDAGLVKGEIEHEAGTGYPSVIISGLTWDGHDFLNAMEDENIWNKAKENILKPGVSFTFGLLLEWLKMKAKEKIGLSEGLEHN